MHYIEDNNTIKHRNKRIKYSLEYCIALKQKEYFKDFDIYSLEKENIFFLCNNKNRRIFAEDGATTKRAYSRKLTSMHSYIDAVYLNENMKAVGENNLVLANWNIVNDFKKDLKNNHSLAVSKIIKDKNNDEYSIKIFNNVDTNISAAAINDYLLIEKNGLKVGDMTVVYTNEKLISSIQNSNESVQILDSSYHAPFFDNKKDAIEYGKENNISITIGENGKKTEASLGYAEGLLNKSFSEYTCVDYDEDLSGLGLGKQMYFYMAQHLNKKGIEFYSSLLLSPKASGLWNSMNEGFEGLVIKGKLFNEEEDNERYKLIVPETLNYDNVKKKIKNKATLKTKQNRY